MTRAGMLAACAAVAALVAGAVGWRSEVVTPASASDVGAAQEGAHLFLAAGCASCHAGPDTTPSIGGLPSLADVPAWAPERNPPMSAAEYVAASIRTPSAFIAPDFAVNGPVTAMPDLGLTEAQIAALVAYLLQG